MFFRKHVILVFFSIQACAVSSHSSTSVLQLDAPEGRGTMVFTSRDRGALWMTAQKRQPILPPRQAFHQVRVAPDRLMIRKTWDEEDTPVYRHTGHNIADPWVLFDTSKKPPKQLRIIQINRGLYPLTLLDTEDLILVDVRHSRSDIYVMKKGHGGAQAKLWKLRNGIYEFTILPNGRYFYAINPKLYGDNQDPFFKGANDGVKAEIRYGQFRRWEKVLTTGPVWYGLQYANNGKHIVGWMPHSYDQASNQSYLKLVSYEVPSGVRKVIHVSAPAEGSRRAGEPLQAFKQSPWILFRATEDGEYRTYNVQTGAIKKDLEYLDDGWHLMERHGSLGVGRVNHYKPYTVIYDKPADYRESHTAFKVISLPYGRAVMTLPTGEWGRVSYIP